jgi:AraC-like DNA-binding protein
MFCSVLTLAQVADRIDWHFQNPAKLISVQRVAGLHSRKCLQRIFNDFFYGYFFFLGDMTITI